MKNIKLFKIFIISFSIGFILFSFSGNLENEIKREKISSSSSPNATIEMKQARWEYFNRMLRDPETGIIPKGIRQQELEFAKKIENHSNQLNKINRINTLDWEEAGPNDVGGRTRALAVDITNPNVIIAGGASGGIWKSTDNGNSWVLKSSLSTILSVTSIAQDPRPGKNNIWYYTTGEWNANLAGTQSTSFTGDGIYKSVDNGETWNVIPSTLSNDFTNWDSVFEYLNKIEVSYSTGSIFVAARGYGIFRSNDEGNSFFIVLGGQGEHFDADISVAMDGTIVAVVSSPFEGFTPQNTPGVYKSTDDGATWTNITPSSFPQDHIRSVVEIAPSNTNIGYVLTYTGDFIGENEDVRFHRINISTGSSEDRSANMASFPFNDGEERISQSWYNLTIAVKPDDENFVLIGATSLFRSTNGFSTKPNSVKQDWIGGYHPDYFIYPNLHPDIHAFAFDPTNPNAVWFGHDGGLSYTSNITNTIFADVFPWENKNNGYNVTQFYHISISQSSGDNRIMGGTQDNGTPYFVYTGTISDQLDDVSGGDGAFSYFGQNYAYTSSQNGSLLRLGYDGQNNPNFNVNWSDITPTDATNQFFINPFCVDPNDENIMYYPAGDIIWRNNQLSSIPNYENTTSTGWTKLDNIGVPFGYGIFALAVSTNPAHILYYSGSSLEGGIPKLYRLNNSNSATNGAIDISIPGAAAGAFVNNIAINPDNANEILVVMSNYNIIGLYHSTDGGSTYTAVEGNLEVAEQSPGPSLRSATILPTSDGTKYYLATSIGIFSAGPLTGNSTVWTSEGQNVLGNVIVSSITSRKSDGKIVAGTHGRGAFTASLSSGSAAIAAVDVSSLSLEASSGGSGNTSFVLRNDGDINLNYNISVNGSFADILPKTGKSRYSIGKAEQNSNKYLEFRKKSNFGKNNIIPKYIYPDLNIHKTVSINGGDKIILDDGNNDADTFVGWGDGTAFDWYNEFNLEGSDFQLDSFEFFLRSETVGSNSIYVAIFDHEFNRLSEGTLTLELSENGDWYTVTLTPAINFQNGATFYIELFSDSSIQFPAGTDTEGQILNKSFYYNGASWVNLNTISGFENGAFLIRAIGTLGEGTENLVTVSPSSGILPPGNQQTVTLTLNAQNLGEGTYTGEVNITTNGGDIIIPINYLVVGVEEINEIPMDFQLSQNYPNPFNPSTVIEFSIPYKANVSLKVFDMLGSEVATLVDEEKTAGTYSVNFDTKSYSSILGRRIASGIYFYSIRTDVFNETRKMLLIK